MSIAHKFRNLCSFKNLKSIAERLGRRSVAGIDGMKGRRFIESGMVDRIRQILRSLARGEYRFTRYREQLILRGANRCPRTISIPTVRDAITIRILMEAIRSGFPEGATPLSFIMVKKIIQKIEMGAYDAFMRLDIKDFYPSISHELLFAALRKKIRSPKIMSLIQQAIQTPTIPAGKKGTGFPLIPAGVPQGLSISNILANIYMLKFDKRWEKRSGCVCFRYVDDILILFCAENLDEIQSAIQNDEQDFRIKIHDDDSEKNQTGLLADREISYLGYTFKLKQNRKVAVGVRGAAMEKIRQSIINILTAYRHSNKRNAHHLQWCLNLRITGCHFDGKWFGWIHYYSQADVSVAVALDKFVEKTMGISRFGIPSELTVASFVTALRAARTHKKRGIPNFDSEEEWPIENKKKLLADVFSVHKISDEKIDRVFRAKIFRHVKQLQKDMHPETGGDGEY